MNGSYQVKLDTFEGPLDLLLHLVNELEIDIYDIPVSEITEQYMNYVTAMQEIELNVASEYLVMAATLLEIKSAMLLPKKEIEYEDEYEEDPRDELIARLIEYRKYKLAAEELKEKELEENQLYTRTPIQFDDQFINDYSTNNGEVSIYDMINALGNVLKRKQWRAPLETKINRMEISIEQRMEEVLNLIIKSDHPIEFDQLFPFPNRTHIVTTFLAVLQLIKNNKIYCKQDVHFQPILISRMEAKSG
ncbi:segregation/condensation protein A [Pseudogracilibacillus sp. SE30717A]|uniref:segregation/condensation protein A n=1 Tax=Pseudogracilibacillus sp. SE30717A TaxID=3098293 RepID=UPI00300E2A9B